MFTLDNSNAQCCDVNVTTDLSDGACASENLTFNISNSNLSAEQCLKLEKFLIQNEDVFSSSLSTIGKTNVFTHRIETVPGAKSVHVNHYRQGPIQKAETERQTKDMLKQGIIIPSTTVCNSPVVLVKKKNNTWRFAIDYRKLNLINKPISHPLLEDVFDCIGDSAATIFSTLDLNSAYFQMELDPETKHKSAFITHKGVSFSVQPYAARFKTCSIVFSNAHVQ